MLKKAKVFFSFILICIVGMYTWFVIISLSPKLPQNGEEIFFYSNQCRQDLRVVTLKALKQAKKSIYMIMFGLSDMSIIRTLQKKARENLNMKVFYDRRSSPSGYLSSKYAEALKTKGLMHQKIMVIDNSLIFLGSANMTKSSLSMHDNLMVGIFSPEIARFLKVKAPFESGVIKTMLGKQRVELWLLPDLNNNALAAIKNELRAAKHSIHVAMFTFTHPVLIGELIKAKKRGVRVETFIDFRSGIGASAKAVDNFKKNHVPVSLSHGKQLFHHKFAYIDEQTLICGSANWTQAAFNKNHDCFLIIRNLSNEQKKFLNKLKKIMLLDAS